MEQTQSFPFIWLVKKLMPLTLAPGRLSRSTSPDLMGSAPITNTMGSVEVAFFAATEAAVVPVTQTLAGLCFDTDMLDHQGHSGTIFMREVI